MNVLALEPYNGGSHKAFLDGWSAHSRHTWTVLGLPAYKWKWRMRHAAITLADEVNKLVTQGQRWDVLFCSDMLNLAEFRGLTPPAVQQLPAIAYFHENQLTYPVQHESERDYHFVLTNMITALSARQVWFNSAFHRDSFLEALPVFLKHMPDYQPLNAVERIRSKCCIQPPGIKEFSPRGPRRPGSMRILWSARWEHDKNPGTFFEALTALKAKGVPFRVSVIGEQFREQPPVFDSAREYFHEHIDRWGYQETRSDYEAALADADVIVSTANHEFFGLSVVEAIAAGAYPLLPDRLAYPEILDTAENPEFFYDGSAHQLAERLAELAEKITTGNHQGIDTDRAIQSAKRFAWKNRAPTLDDALKKMLM